MDHTSAILCPGALVDLLLATHSCERTTHTMRPELRVTGVSATKSVSPGIGIATHNKKKSIFILQFTLFRCSFIHLLIRCDSCFLLSTVKAILWFSDFLWFSESYLDSHQTIHTLEKYFSTYLLFFAVL